MAYVNKRSGKNRSERFTALYKTVDGTCKSAETFDTEGRALEVAEAAACPCMSSSTPANNGRRGVPGDDPPPAHGGAEGGRRQPDDGPAHTDSLVVDDSDGLDNGYRKDNPVRGIKLKGVPAKPVIVATKDQFLRVYNALPHRPAKVSARVGVSSGARLCELISFTRIRAGQSQTLIPHLPFPVRRARGPAARFPCAARRRRESAPTAPTGRRR